METSTIDTPAEESLLTGADPSAAPAASSQPPAAGAGTTTQPAAGFVNADGTLSDKWLDALPEDAKDYKDTLAKYKSVPDMAKALVNANQLIGKKLGVPNEKSSPEEIAAYRKALGIPDTVEDYKFAPDQMPDGFKWNDDFAKPFAEVAHRHNIPPAAMKALANQFTVYEKFKVEAIQGAYEKQRTEAVQTLQKEWGGDFAKNIGIAKQAAKMAGVDSNSHGFSDPEVVRMAVRLAGMMGEDRVGRGATSVDFLAGKARADDIMKNPENPWHKRYQEGDREAAALVTSLLRQG